MNDPRFALVRFPDELTDADAAAVLDFLQDLATTFENHYAGQLRRYYQHKDRTPAAPPPDQEPPF